MTSLLGALAVSMKISPNGLHKISFGNHQSRAKVSNCWTGSGTQRFLNFYVNCQHLKTERFHIFKKIQIFSFSSEILEDLATLSLHSYLVTLGWSQIAAVSLDGTWTLKFAHSLHHCYLLDTKDKGSCHYLTVLLIYKENLNSHRYICFQPQV